MILENRKPHLKNLIIKPELNCNANCGFCAQRLRCHDNAKMDPKINKTQWKGILLEAAELGALNLHISGGEPTLYADLIEIIEYARQIGLTVNLNTNGILLNKKYISDLENAGLKSCTISLHSNNKDIHQELKGISKGFDEIMNSIRILKKSRIDLYIQTILCHQNINHFDLFLKLMFDLSISVVFVSYMEGTEKVYFPTEYDIIKFKKEIAPKCIEVINNSVIESSIKDNLIQSLNRFFSLPVSNKEIANGIYNNSLLSCNVPFESAIVLGNGKVLPSFRPQVNKYKFSYDDVFQC